MEESLSSKHSCELFSDSLEHLLDGSWVSNKCNGHLKSLWWDITNGWFDVIGDPFNKVRRVLILDIEHLFVDFFGWHSSSEESWGSQISSVSWISSTHHILGIKHLLCEFWDCEGSVLLWSSWCEWCKTNHEEVESWEWNQVDSQFSKIWVQLTWES